MHKSPQDDECRKQNGMRNMTVKYYNFYKLN